jgi:DtxR family transcriptional regulator, Mn-dependent transcriptional regulator
MWPLLAGSIIGLAIMLERSFFFARRRLPSRDFAGRLFAFTISISMENYLETIFHLVREHTVARVKDIADRLKVSRSSVTGMLQSLRDHHFVNFEPYGFVTLTTKGTKIAKRVVRRHEALRDFMVEVLSIDAEVADEAACHMEHGISKQVVDRFLEFAEFVQTCPRAGAKWINGFGYRCAEAGEAPGDCKRCIATCLESVKEGIQGRCKNE